jgi:hypothetical protein
MTYLMMSGMAETCCEVKTVYMYSIYIGIMFTERIINSKRHDYPCNKPWKPRRLCDIEASTFSRQSAHRWR